MTEHYFDSRQDASTAAAKRIGDLLRKRLDGNGGASLVVSGGTSPKQCMAALANAPMDWSRVQVLLSDERWVPPDHEDSNERLTRETLLVGGAASAELFPIYAAGVSPEERCNELQDPLPMLPFSCSLIGIGTDGHFASLFPDAEQLELGLDVEGDRLYIPVTTAASPHPRISMTLAGISRSDEIVLLFFGEEKLDVYKAAKASADTYPLSRLLRQKRAPVRLFWAP
ncbi:MAG: 6-phosphogluconolactonase [Gammaproteobacteria bacterium]|nr:6-phosphogluconolactonase [Gammaproteobacteria bacterium]MBU2677869.1 6-phosphogluconolactonase [Gammaproteobacteria bacterium]NNC56475.1 6-phosphogluconolactonase [Woeseiaceae bacterium]NNL51601.1 6-phosphogluconolactonase [Woeseiaceae bacterium]